MRFRGEVYVYAACKAKQDPDGIIMKELTYFRVRLRAGNWISLSIVAVVCFARVTTVSENVVLHVVWKIFIPRSRPGDHHPLGAMSVQQDTAPGIKRGRGSNDSCIHVPLWRRGFAVS